MQLFDLLAWHTNSKKTSWYVPRSLQPLDLSQVVAFFLVTYQLAGVGGSGLDDLIVLEFRLQAEMPG